jgi:hypothetical protein
MCGAVPRFLHAFTRYDDSLEGQLCFCYLCCERENRYVAVGLGHGR